MNFTLTEQQRQDIAAWSVAQDKKAIEMQRASMTPQEFEQNTAGGKYPYGGAIGGTLTYCFTPTGLGVVASVRHGLTQEELDVTDYATW